MKKRRRRSKFAPPTPFRSKYHDRWLVRFYKGGKRHERKFKDKVAAIEFCNRLWEDRQDGIDSQEITLEQLIQRFLASRADHAGSTIADYKRTLAQAAPLYTVPIRMISPIVLDELISEQATPASRHRLRSKLSMLFRQAIRWELLRRNPIDATSVQSYRPKKAETFTPDEVDKILATASDHRLVGMFDLGFTLGLRPEELFGFQWQDWDEDAEQLSVRRKVAETGGRIEIGPPKTAASVRDLRLPEHITQRLRDRRRQAMKEGRASKSSWIWPNIRGNPMRRSNLRNHVWTKLLKDAGVPYRKLYCMRHTAATTMLNGRNGVAGIPLAVVSGILGHDNPQVTLEVYSHVLLSDQDHAKEFWKRAKRDLTGSG